MSTNGHLCTLVRNTSYAWLGHVVQCPLSHSGSLGSEHERKVSEGKSNCAVNDIGFYLICTKTMLIKWNTQNPVVWLILSTKVRPRILSLPMSKYSVVLVEMWNLY